MSSQELHAIVVEDDLLNRMYILRLLSQLGYRHTVFENAEDCLAGLDNMNVDCFLVDIGLGSGMSGLDLMKTLRKRAAFAVHPMFAVTAYKDFEGENFIEAGFTGHLEKPFSKISLQNILHKSPLDSNK